jgi:hypothetical protein
VTDIDVNLLTRRVSGLHVTGNRVRERVYAGLPP